VIRGERASAPFPLLSVVDEPSLHRKAAECYGGEKFPRVFASMEGLKQAVASPSKKIRIGYFSADFREHAVSYLIAELLESHDRKKFEVFGFSLRESSSDGMRQRIARSCDRFIDLHSKSDQDAGRVIAELQIDIGIDLGGYTKYARTGIFSQKRMPIQAHYLGYIGTMGLDYFDYIVADKTVLPESNKDYLSEKIIYLPNSFQANDSTRQISDKSFTKEELGLPVDGFIFCCFNNNYKIVPQTFSAWMRILKATKGSVLWLFEDSPQVARNLAKEASQRGIDPNRLIFAKHLPRADYMARYKVADLFLDTLPYNAGTTASDALWVGLPVLTCMGNSFAGRMAASLLTNIGLPELITRSLQEYESLAIELATNPDKLTQIKTKLAENRLTTPLFDTPLFTKHIEAAYQAVYDRYQSGLQPDHIYLPPERNL
jgi:predicted O-linked N-acetylglucosamine transferase (SPINDLY family)